MKQKKQSHQLIDLVESLLDENHSLSFRMHGNSMFPTLRDGDLGYVEKCSYNELLIGDILVFKVQDKLIAHRLIEQSRHNDTEQFLTKGDKNNFKDKVFGQKELIGKVTHIQRKNKTIQLNSTAMKIQKVTALHFSSILIPFFDAFIGLRNQLKWLNSGLQTFGNNLSIISTKSEKLLAINSIIAFFQGVIPFIIILLIKLLIDQLTNSSQNTQSQPLMFISLLVITTLVFLTNGILGQINSYFNEKLSQSVMRQVYEKLHTKHLEIDLSNYENHEKQDKMHRALQEASFRPIKILNGLLIGIKSVASALFLTGLFFSIRWYLVLILIVAILPGIYVRLKVSKRLYKLKDSQSTKEREMYYYNRVLTGFPFAKELKLFGFFDYFRQRFATSQETLFEQKMSLRKSELGLEIYAQVFAVLLIFVSLGFVSMLKIKGEISIGTVVLFFFAFQRGYSVLNDLFRSMTQIIEDNTFLKDFIGFLHLPTNNSTELNTDFSLEKEIRFTNVSFRYESSKRDALSSINLTIPVGKTVAFVGANGSGKTTMIKLMCGFYTPSSGSISYDGTDTVNLGQSTICNNITAVFQDFALYNIPAIENIGLGQTNFPLNEEKAKEAAKAAGIDTMFEQLPNGYNTLLGNLFKDGEELSIGQWQKIALARAFYRNSALILMDEPSSALDVDAELQVIDSLKKLSRNKTAVIISHRLSTVQWADIICFFENGKIVESGNHVELMEAKGKYFELFLKNNKTEKQENLSKNSNN